MATEHVLNGAQTARIQGNFLGMRNGSGFPDGARSFIPTQTTSQASGGNSYRFLKSNFTKKLGATNASNRLNRTGPKREAITPGATLRQTGSQRPVFDAAPFSLYLTNDNRHSQTQNSLGEGPESQRVVVKTVQGLFEKGYKVHDEKLHSELNQYQNSRVNVMSQDNFFSASGHKNGQAAQLMPDRVMTQQVRTVFRKSKSRGEISKFTSKNTSTNEDEHTIGIRHFSHFHQPKKRVKTGYRRPQQLLAQPQAYQGQPLGYLQGQLAMSTNPIEGSSQLEDWQAAITASTSNPQSNLYTIASDSTKKVFGMKPRLEETATADRDADTKLAFHPPQPKPKDQASGHRQRESNGQGTD